MDLVHRILLERAKEINSVSKVIFLDVETMYDAKKACKVDYLLTVLAIPAIVVVQPKNLVFNILLVAI